MLAVPRGQRISSPRGAVKSLFRPKRLVTLDGSPATRGFCPCSSRCSGRFHPAPPPAPVSAPSAPPRRSAATGAAAAPRPPRPGPAWGSGKEGRRCRPRSCPSLPRRGPAVWELRARPQPSPVGPGGGSGEGRRGPRPSRSPVPAWGPREPPLRPGTCDPRRRPLGTAPPEGGLPRDPPGAASHCRLLRVRDVGRGARALCGVFRSWRLGRRPEDREGQVRSTDARVCLPHTQKPQQIKGSMVSVVEMGYN